MAGRTVVGGIDVRIAFTDCCCAIVTAFASAQYLVVINISRGNWLPWRWCNGMAGIAYISAADVGVALTCCSYAIMTTDATTNDFIVIDVCRCDWTPGCRSWCMAGLAVIAGSNVRIGFTNSGGAIVTTDTGTDHLGMINCIRCHWRPGGREDCMTGIAGIR